MKKFITLIFIVALLFCSLLGCNNTQPSTNDSNSPDDTPVADALPPKEDLLKYDEYTLEAYLKPFWYTREVYNETVMFVGAEDEAELLYEADEILSVKSYDLTTEYTEIFDWSYKNGKIKRTKSSKIPYWEIDDYYISEPDAVKIIVDKSKTGIELDGIRYIKISEGTTFTSKQLAITYTHSEKWNGPIPVDKSSRFPNTLSKLSAGQSPKIVLCGDSISTGANASGTIQGGMCSPYMPPFHIMVEDYLNEKFSTDVSIVNTSVGGTDSTWGYTNLYENIIKHEPDLAIIAFGMNDGSKTPEQYKIQMTALVTALHKNSPNTEIMLVTSMLPNIEDTAKWDEKIHSFAQSLLPLENAFNYVSVANVTEMHQAMFDAGKRYRDVTGNNINHPNDFVIRLYAQVILNTLLGEGYCPQA